MKFEFVYFFNFKQENFNDNHLKMYSLSHIKTQFFHRRFFST